MEKMKQELKEMIIRELKVVDVTPDQLEDDSPLFGDGLGLDSLDAVELVVLIQKHYGIQIGDMEEGSKAFASVNALAQYIKKHHNPQ